MRTAYGGWYQCIECKGYLLIGDMQAVKAIDMRVLPTGEYRGKCPHCYKSNNVLYPRLRKTGLMDAMQLTWEKFKTDVKGGGTDGA